MKKTLTTLALLLSGVALAAEMETITYDTLFDSGDGWSFDRGRNQGNGLNITGGSVTANGLNWAQQIAYHGLDTVITLKKPEDTLTFSFKVNQNGTDNSVATVSLVGTNGAIAAGMGYSNDVKFSTTTENTTSKAYIFSNTAWDRGVASKLDAIGTVGTLTNNSSLTVTGTIAWSAADNQFALTMTGYDTPVLLGETYNVSSVSLGFDGPNNNNVASLSDLTIVAQVAKEEQGGSSSSTIPEPATAALSLLALAGLAARRRRK